MDDHGIAWKVSGYLALLAVAILVGYVFLNGLMFLVRPKRWARSSWALYPEQFLDELDSASYRFGMRVLGFILVLFCVGVVLGSFGIDTAPLERIGYAVYWLSLLLALVPTLFIGGLYFLILPKRWDGPLDSALRNRVRNSLVLQVLVRVFGLACCWVSWQIIVGLFPGARLH